MALKILLIAVEIICSFLIVVVILLQKSKGEGLGMAFGAEMGESIFGARASNVLVKVTIWLGTIFIVNTVILAMIYTNAPSRSILGGRLPAPMEQPAPVSLPVTPTAPGPAIPPAQSPPPPAAPTLPAAPAMPAVPATAP
jgi:preprotein translocase subunit SecG